jgi:hypothetical protein
MKTLALILALTVAAFTSRAATVTGLVSHVGLSGVSGITVRFEPTNTPYGSPNGLIISTPQYVVTRTNGWFTRTLAYGTYRVFIGTDTRSWAMHVPDSTNTFDWLWLTTNVPTIDLTRVQLREERGQTNGYASLDATGKVPTNQLPSGLGEVTTAQLNTASNAVQSYTLSTSNLMYSVLFQVLTNFDTLTSNGLYSIIATLPTYEMATNVARFMATNTAILTSNSLYAFVLSHGTAVSNGVIAQVLASSNSLRAAYIQADTVVSNGAVAFAMTASNSVAALAIANDTTTSNALRSLLIGNDTTTSNGAVSFVMTASNNIVTLLVSATNGLASAGRSELLAASNYLFSVSGGGGSTTNITTNHVTSYFQNFFPKTHLAYDLGATNNYWRSLYASNIYGINLNLDELYVNDLVVTNSTGDGFVVFSNSPNLFAPVIAGDAVADQWTIFDALYVMNTTEETLLAVDSSKQVMSVNIGSGLSYDTGTRTLSATGGGGSSSFNTTNIYVTNTAPIVVKVADFDRAVVHLMTNAHLTFTNVNSLARRFRLLLQQDTNGQRSVTFSNATGLLQTNASLVVTTNANALDVLEGEPSFFPTNVFVWWPQNLQPRVAFTNSLAGSGVGGGGSCSASPAVQQAGPAGATIGTSFSTTVHRAGTVWTNGAAATNLCKASFEMTLDAGNITTKNFRVRVYSMTGNNLNAQIGQSDAVLGTNSWANTLVDFPFSTHVSLSANTRYAIVVETDEGPDSSNSAKVGYQNTGTIATAYVAYFNSSGVQQSTPDNGADAVLRFYFLE